MTPALIVLASLAIFGYTVNLQAPWEGDQSAKAAQIMEIADANDFFLSDGLQRCYFLKLLSLYYSMSGVVYDLVGGPIFRFMNLSSVVAGTMAVVFAAYAIRNALGVHPLWSAVVLLSMPLVVISSTYGNEAIWAIAMISLSLLLATCRAPWLHYGSGVAMACALFCRADMLFALPFWFCWVALFGPANDARHSIVRRMTPVAIVFGAAAALLWVLLVREIPEPPLSFEWKTNLMLVAAFLSYPFNPSIVLMAAAGWLVLWKVNTRYALIHLLLLTPILFYFGNLSSPKYLFLCVLFYGIPAALLLERGNRLVRAVALAAMMFWWVFGASNFGVFAPGTAALWYVPSADGPIPAGGYLAFYGRAREGFYQAKQVQRIALTSAMVEAAQEVGPDVRLLGAFDEISMPYVRCLRRRQGQDTERLIPPRAEDGDTKFVIIRTDYLGLARGAPKWLDMIRGYLERGQVRPIRAADGAAFPDVVEIGDQVPVDTNRALGRRIAFVQDYYKGHMVFQLPEFIPAYAATCWVTASEAEGADQSSQIYADDQYVGFDREIDAAQQIFGFAWPARFYNFQPPRPHL
jgi:hypothetical protein